MINKILKIINSDSLFKTLVLIIIISITYSASKINQNQSKILKSIGTNADIIGHNSKAINTILKKN